jgi:MFS transporter, MHS family, proline/betaine transporter
LYLHMAVVLNAFFFPTEHPLVKTFLPAFSFCSTFLLRPFGALLFGYVGDFFGRKAAIILSTTMMALCCLTLAALPTYAAIGVAAPIILTICRMLQGMCATAEVTGVEIYLSESIKPPKQYQMVAYVTVFTCLGAVAAVGIGALFTSTKIFPEALEQYSWRFAFFLGACIGIVGAIARTSLKEATEFADKKGASVNNAPVANSTIEEKNILKLDQETPFATSVNYFFLFCAKPSAIYFIFIHCGEILRSTFGFSVHQVLVQNFFVTIVDTLGLAAIAYLSAKIKPLKIVKARLFIFLISMSFFPIAIKYYPSSVTIFIFQGLATVFMPSKVPASPIFFKYFPIAKRFRYAAFINALATLATYIFSSFGLTILSKKFGYTAILLSLIPLAGVFGIGLRYFEKKEKRAEDLFNIPTSKETAQNLL